MKSKSGVSSVRVIFIILGAMVGIWVVHLVLYPANQATRVYEKMLDADNAIYNYEFFKQAYQDIKAMDEKIVTARAAVDQFVKDTGPRDKWDFRDKEESARLNTNLIGLKNVRNDMVATYNGRAKMVNRSIFMGKDVPSSIDQVEK
ncbi:MAG: hypothetical protein WCW14_00715 [Candidatus Paceibacterota bacterium]|jgi:hypothetical protein